MGGKSRQRSFLLGGMLGSGLFKCALVDLDFRQLELEHSSQNCLFCKLHSRSQGSVSAHVSFTLINRSCMGKSKSTGEADTDSFGF